jgi:hypothetical protein
MVRRFTVIVAALLIGVQTTLSRVALMGLTKLRSGILTLPARSKGRIPSMETALTPGTRLALERNPLNFLT